jgi:outer membrane protein TolC
VPPFEGNIVKPISIGVAAPLALAILSGCASLPPDGGVGELQPLLAPRVKQEVRAVGGDAARTEAAAAVRERLREPLSAEDAVAIALLNRPAVQVALADLGISTAEAVQAGRIANPSFSWGRFRQGEEREIERRIVLDVVGLVLLPLRAEMARGNLEAARGRVALDIVRLADEARRAWIEAVAAAEMARYAAQVKDAADAGAELAAGMERAGNFSKLERARQQLFGAEADARLARARLAEVQARERLVRALGLEADAALLRLPDRLPDLPAPRAVADAEGAAVASRLDVLGARREADAVARSLGLSRVTRFVNVLHLGYEHTTSNESPRRTGYEIELELPIFDWGDAKSARAEAVYRQALERVRDAAVRARSEARESHAAYASAHAVARRYRTEIVPLRKEVSEEMLLRYNGMLVSVFDLLADAREQAAAVIAAIEATRDFWLADASLDMALLTGSPAAPSPRTAASAAPTGAAGGH